MTEVYYEFPAEDPSRMGGPAGPRRKWLIAVLLVPVLVAAGWGIMLLDRKWTEAKAREVFKLDTDHHNQVFIAIAHVPDVRKESIALLAKFPHLQGLWLDDAASVEGGVESLRPLAGLRALSLQNCTWVDDEQAARLAELPNLTRLNLGGTSITDAGLRAISKLPQLGCLNIERCRGVTDAGLEICAGMDQLQFLRPGGAGYSVDRLVSLREARRDLTLMLEPSAFLPPVVDNVKRGAAVNFGGEGLADDQTSVTWTLSTTADVEVLKKFLRFKHDWRNRSSASDVFRVERSERAGNYLEDVAGTWGELELTGAAAGAALADIFPLTPKLTGLTLNEASLSLDTFPFDRLPPGLRRLYLSRLEVSQPFLERLVRDSKATLLELNQVRVDGVDVIRAEIGDITTWGWGHLVIGSDTNVERNLRVGINLDAPSARGPLEKLLPLAPEVSSLVLHHAALDGDHHLALDAESFPFDLMPQELHRLTVMDAEVNEDFLRILSERVAVKYLELYRVDLKGVDVADPAMGRLTSLRSLRLVDATVDGVDLTDSALDPLRSRLQEQLPVTGTIIDSSGPPAVHIEWGDPVLQ